MTSKEQQGKDGEALVFISPMIKYLGDSTEMHGDSTFEAVPAKCQQMFTGHIILGGKVRSGEISSKQLAVY